MVEFTSIKTKKILNAFAQKELIFDGKIRKLRDLKRIRLGDDIQMLALPKYETIKVVL